MIDTRLGVVAAVLVVLSLGCGSDEDAQPDATTSTAEPTTTIAPEPPPTEATTTVTVPPPTTTPDPCAPAAIQTDLAEPAAAVVAGACVDGWALVTLNPDELGDLRVLARLDGATWVVHTPFPSPLCLEEAQGLGVPPLVLDQIQLPACPVATTAPPAGSALPTVAWSCQDLAADGELLGNTLAAAYGDYQPFADAPGFFEEVGPWMAAFSAQCGRDYAFDAINEGSFVGPTYQALSSMIWSPS